MPFAAIHINSPSIAYWAAISKALASHAPAACPSKELSLLSFPRGDDVATDAVARGGLGEPQQYYSACHPGHKRRV